MCRCEPMRPCVLALRNSHRHVKVAKEGFATAFQLRPSRDLKERTARDIQQYFSMLSVNALNQLILDPKYADLLSILKGTRNGLVYGVKVRFPHALVMAILFGRGDWKTRIKSIFRATKTHAFNLARFVTIYKTLLLLQKRLNGGKEAKADTFIAGLLGGYAVFGERTAINEQIVLYVTSRVVASFIPREVPSPLHLDAAAPVRPLPPNPRIFSLFAAVTWGAVMWLFEHRGETIQPGMFNSMTYLYRDSDHWKDLRTLFWHNK